MINPFLINDTMHEALNRLAAAAWDAEAHEPLLLALEFQILIEHSANNETASLKSNVYLASYVEWLSRHYMAAPTVAQRLRFANALAMSRDIGKKDEDGHPRRYGIFKDLLDDAYDDDDTFYHSYLIEIFGLSRSDCRRLDELVGALQHEARTSSQSGPVPLLEDAIHVTELAEKCFRGLASLAFERTNIHVDSHYYRPFTIVTSRGDKNLFLSSSYFFNPLEAAKAVHELAHLVDYEVTKEQDRDWHQHSTLEKESHAVEIEHRYITELFQSFGKPLFQAWRRENFDRQLALFTNELSLLKGKSTSETNLRTSPSDFFGMPLLSAVYVVAADHALKSALRQV